MRPTIKQQNFTGERGPTPSGDRKQVPSSNSKQRLFAFLNVERKGQGHTVASSVDQAPQRYGRADPGKNSHGLRALASFPRSPSAGSRVGGVSQQVSSWSPEALEEEKQQKIPSYF